MLKFKGLAQGQVALTTRDKVVLTLNTFFMAVLFVVFLYPLLYVVISSLSANAYEIKGLTLIPESWSLEGYKVVFEFKELWIGYRNSLFYSLFGCTITLCTTIFCAYPLSRRDLVGRGPLLAIMMFTMYFSGGLIPTFLMMRDMGLVDNVWALILPGAMSVYNMLVMRTYFMNSVPEELYEAAEIDGCGQFQYLIKVLLPLSVPVLAVIALWTIVGEWNSYFDALIYIRNRNLYPLQLVLREVLILNYTLEDLLTMDPDELLLLEQRQNLMRYSVIVVASLPMLILYPFVQKYFTQGIMLGAVKG